MQMIDIVNRNSADMKAKRKAMLEKRNECRKARKRIASLRKCKSENIINILVSLVMFVLVMQLYAVSLTEMWFFIAASALLGVCVIFNAYRFIKNAMELKKMT